MRTIVISNQKGGAGKTTLCGHLGVALSQAEKGSVVFIDLDPQAGLSDWWNDRQAEEPGAASCDRVADLPKRLKDLDRGGAGWCLIDTPPARSEANLAAIRAADLVLIPLKPSRHDLKAAMPTVEMCRAQGKRFVFVLNETKDRAAANAQAVAALSQFGPICPGFLTARNLFRDSMTDGRTLMEVQPSNKGAEEVMAVMSFVLEQFEPKPVRVKEKIHG